ncbi:MAG: hypothetical protein IKV85_01615 [Ruminococcus sp.]|nr:hypothetical protein [Ruminococcus sp.]
MKKFLAFLTALTALFCTACDNKQDSISENPPVGDVTASVSETDISEDKDGNTETSVNSDSTTELKHYTINDFREIKVNLNVQDTPPPVEFKEYDLSGIEFEAKKSPCKLPENVKIENICPDSENIANRFEMEHEEYCQQFIEDYAPILEAEEKPIILYTAFDGENLYYLGDYDTACPATSHNFEIFKYNPETGENVSIYEYSHGTEGVSIADMIYNNGLVLLTFGADSLKQSVFDEETGEFVFSDDLFVGHIDIKSVAQPGYTSSYKKHITLHYTLADKEEPTVELVRKNDKITAKTDRYTLETGISNCQTVMSDESRLILLQAEDSYNVLHTFDFEKMEKYTTDLSMQRNQVKAYPMGKNVIIYYDYIQQYMFFIPELGAGFNLNDTDSYTYSSTDSMININIDTSLRVEQSLIGVSDNGLAILNYETLFSDFYYFIYEKPFIYEDSSTMDICDHYAPSKNNPLKKLYIFEAD